MKNIGRREFLTGAAVLGAGAALAGCSKPAAEEKLSNTGDVPSSADSGATVLTKENQKDVKWSFEIPDEPIAADQITDTVTADIVVVGAGFSGIVTALSAAEAGADVIVVSASDSIVVRGGSMNARGSKAMDAMKGKLKFADDKQFMREQLACAGYNVDQKKWWKFVKNSPEAMNWLIDQMEAEGFTTVLERGFDMGGDTFFSSLPGSHSWTIDDEGKAGKGSQVNVMEVLFKNAQAAGIRFEFSQPVRQLVRGGQPNGTEGRVTGAVAQTGDGTYVVYEGTKGVVMATGDFSTNHDMMAKYCPEFVPLLNDPLPEPDYNSGFGFGGLMPGDGHKMGLWIGAAWQKTYPNAPMTFAVGTAGPFNQPYSGHRGLLVNKFGERYGNEDVPGVFAGIAQIHQPDMQTFAIWSANYAKDAAPWVLQGSKIGDDPTPPEAMLEAWKNGEMSPDPQEVYQSDSLEDLIGQMGLPVEATMATVKRYNELCTKGEDEDFQKSAEQMVGITEPPFFGAVGAVPHFLTVTGGLRTDDYMRVCEEDDTPIEGLFNVGTMVGDYYGNIYNFLVEGNNLGACCLTFGHMTGRGLADGTLS